MLLSCLTLSTCMQAHTHFSNPPKRMFLILLPKHTGILYGMEASIIIYANANIYAFSNRSYSLSHISHVQTRHKKCT